MNSAVITVRAVHLDSDHCDGDRVVAERACNGWKSALTVARSMRDEFCDGRRARRWGWFGVETVR